MTEYKADAYVRVPFSIYIEAVSSLEAMEIADEKAKKFSEVLSQYLSLKELYEHKDSEGWSMTCDEVILQIDLTYQVNTCMRPFIRDFDD